MPHKTIVAISSFVMRGTVGLRAILFTLERRGETVWAAPTVTMPWHPGLGRSTRDVAQDLPQQLAELATRAGEVDGLITGYFANAAQVEAAARLIDAVKAARADAVILVDPVTGDESGRYVPDEVADAIVRDLFPRADVATPNVNELRDLAGAASVEAARGLGAAVVIATSAVNTNGRMGSWVVEADGVQSVTHERIARSARGTGDMFAAVLLSEMLAGAKPVAAARTASAATLAVVTGSDEVALDLVGHQEAIAAPDLSMVDIEPL